MTWTMDKLAEQENTIARLRSDLAALVPLARVGARLWIDSGYTGDLKMLDAARRVLAAYDQEGT